MRTFDRPAFQQHPRKHALVLRPPGLLNAHEFHSGSGRTSIARSQHHRSRTAEFQLKTFRVHANMHADPATGWHAADRLAAAGARSERRHAARPLMLGYLTVVFALERAEAVAAREAIVAAATAAASTMALACRCRISVP